jgi:hypothetical protein
MHSKKELCRKITELYPDIGECGIDVDADYDKKKKVWIINLKIPDADDCMEGRQCTALGLEIAQLRKNIEGKQF